MKSSTIVKPMIREALLGQLSELQRLVLNSALSPTSRLVALWDVGDLLKRARIDRPHSFGESAQEATRGAVTRAVVFRGAKARSIWAAAADIRNELPSLRSIQYFYDMIAVLDDKKRIAYRLDPDNRAALMRAAQALSTDDFRHYLQEVKSQISSGALGTDKRTTAGLRGMRKTASSVIQLTDWLGRCIEDEHERHLLNETVSVLERSSLANMAIAVASPLNRRLDRSLGPEHAASADPRFSVVYDAFKKLLGRKDDRERSRLRKYLSADDFEALASRLAALRDESSLSSFIADEGLTVSLDRRRPI